MPVRVGVRATQPLPADRAETGAVGAAQELDRERQTERIVSPQSQCELVAIDVRASELLVVGAGLVDLAGVDLDRDIRLCEAAHARPRDVRREPHPDRETAGGAREVEARGYGAVGHDVSLAPQLELPGIGLDVEAAPLARAKRKTGKIETVKSR